MLLRLHLLIGREDYLEASRTLSENLHHYGFKEKNGLWYSTIANDASGDHGAYTYWWIQAYGNMFDLILYRVFNESFYLNSFKKGAASWDAFFLDKKMGDTYLSVDENGDINEVIKANQFKTSYHSMELGLLNYLYTGFWVNHDPVTLYFWFNPQEEGEMLYPVPIEESNIKITGLRIDGVDQAPMLSNNKAIQLPHLKNGSIEVTVLNTPK